MTTTTEQRSGARRPRRGEPRRSSSRPLVLPDSLTVKDLAELLDQSPIDVIKQLMRHGIMVNVNQVIDHQVAAVAAAAYGVRTRLAEQSANTASPNAAGDVPPNRFPYRTCCWSTSCTASVSARASRPYLRGSIRRRTPCSPHCGSVGSGGASPTGEAGGWR